jgi:hypothetical protein
MRVPTVSEVCTAIVHEHADGLLRASKRRRGRAGSDSEIGVSQVVGGYHDHAGTLRLIAVRRCDRDRREVVEVAEGERKRVLATVYGGDPAAKEHAFTVAAERLAEAKRVGAG